MSLRSILDTRNISKSLDLTILGGVKPVAKNIIGVCVALSMEAMETKYKVLGVAFQAQ